MYRTRGKAGLLALALVSAGGIASADDKNPAANKAEKQSQMPQKESERSAAEVMKITQTALAHVNAAQTAIAKGNRKAAKQALDQSENALEKLYDAPMFTMMLNELDEAIAKAQTGKDHLQTLDLAPLAASVRSYQAYIDPSVAAGVDEAAAKAKQGDATATVDALRLARNRMAVDIAFLPVEEAYIRVLGARSALDEGNTKRAAKILQGLPVVVAEVQTSTPLVPIRFKLNAAATAAETGNWERSKTLVREATTAIQTLEKNSKGTAVASEVSSIVDDVEKLNQKMGTATRPRPQDIRDVAARTRDLGA